MIENEFMKQYQNILFICRSHIALLQQLIPKENEPDVQEIITEINQNLPKYKELLTNLKTGIDEYNTFLSQTEINEEELLQLLKNEPNPDKRPYIFLNYIENK